MPGTITQRNVFEEADSTYLDGVFDGRSLKAGQLTPAAGSYALSERETSCKREGRGIFDGRPLKTHPLPAVMHLRSVKCYVNGKEGCHGHTHVTLQMRHYGTRKVNGNDGPNCH